MSPGRQLCLSFTVAMSAAFLTGAAGSAKELRWVGLNRVVDVTGLAATKGALWVSTNFLGLWRSTDGGRTWKAANNGLPLLAVTSLMADSNDSTRLYATVPSNGIFTLQEER